MLLKEGRILKGVGGFYEVLTVGGETVTCKAKGAFRKEGLTPTVGDLTEFAVFKEGYGQLENILPRRNLLVRPAVANIDRLLIVLSAHLPEPDYLLADKLIIEAKLSSIEPVLLLNKADEADAAVVSAFERDYAMFPSLQVSAKTGLGKESLIGLISGKVCCFAGQSAVGKSSLMNMLLPELSLETGELTRKTERGKHTTRHAQLWPCFGGALLDTPGFSLYEPETYDQQLLNACYPDFAQAEPCYYTDCSHIKEPDCGVKALVQQGKISAERYRRYVEIAEDFTFRRKHQYD